MITRDREVCSRLQGFAASRFERDVRLEFHINVRWRFHNTLGFILVLIGSGVSGAATLNEPMNGTTAPGWVIGGSAYLTASTGLYRIRLGFPGVRPAIGVRSALR